MSTPADRRRRVALALGVAEYLLGRPVRTVLDIGCGEGFWRSPLLALRPRIRYTGVDPSAYAVSRFGARRAIRHGRVDRLDAAGVRGPYDLVVCADVLHYLPPAELASGLAGIARRTGGLAYLPTVTTADDVDGDVRGIRPPTAARFRAAAHRAGLAPLGLDCYVPRDALGALTALEQPPACLPRARSARRTTS